MTKIKTVIPNEFGLLLEAIHYSPLIREPRGAGKTPLLALAQPILQLHVVTHPAL